ncbi:MAG: hypothetical protein WDO13_01370 [Verrucomicrobiota bacterium]
MPHLVAAVLAGNVGDESLPLAGGGFRDTTRIASARRSCGRKFSGPTGKR